MARPRYKSEPAPKVVSVGSVSKRRKLPKWNPKPTIGYTKVKTPRTIV